jgi:hypothetical protein
MMRPLRVALEAVIPRLPRYQRSMANYASGSAVSWARGLCRTGSCTDRGHSRAGSHAPFVRVQRLNLAPRMNPLAFRLRMGRTGRSAWLPWIG